MALTLGSGIDYQGTENNFARDYFENLADMVAMRSKSLPKMFIAMCGETGKAYLYNKSAEADETLGKWKELPLGGEGSSSGSSGFDTEPAQIDVYGFTQGNITEEQVFEAIGNKYFAVYGGDGGRGNDNFLPNNDSDRTHSYTVYVENATKFGTAMCKLFAVSNFGKSFRGYFDTAEAEPTFSPDNIIWEEIGAGGSEAGAPIYELEMEGVEGEENFPDYSYEKFNFRREQNLLAAVKGDLHDAPEAGTFVKYLKNSYDGYPEIYQLTVFGYTDTGMDMAGTKWVFKPLINKDGRGTITIKYNPYDDENEGYSVEETVSEVPEEETSTIDFSTWPEFTAPEANGIVLDGQGGANVDGSNVGVDPDDIEPDD